MAWKSDIDDIFIQCAYILSDVFSWGWGRGGGEVCFTPCILNLLLWIDGFCHAYKNFNLLDMFTYPPSCAQLVIHLIKITRIGKIKSFRSLYLTLGEVWLFHNGGGWQYRWHEVCGPKQQTTRMPQFTATVSLVSWA